MPTASTIVCCGASLSITAMSPNCRSASTSTTGVSLRAGQDDGQVGGDDRLAGAALGGEDGDDPAELAASARRRGGRRAAGRSSSVSPTRRTDSASCAGLDRRGSTSLTPARSACWNSSVDELVGDEDRADLGVARRAAARPRRAPSSVGARRAEHDHDRRAGEPLAERVERRRTARRSSPSCMARRLRTAWSASTTATATAEVRSWGRCPMGTRSLSRDAVEVGGRIPSRHRPSVASRVTDFCGARRGRTA